MGNIFTISLFLITFISQAQSKIFYKNGKIESEGYYVDNMKSGIWEYYHDNGKLSGIGTYINNKPNGKWQFYYNSGQLSTICNYENGQPDGEWKRLGMDGTTELILNYKNGLLDGEYKNYSLFEITIGQYKNGLKEGIWEIFKNVWIMPNPGDSGSALGAAAALYGDHVGWNGPYLGTSIDGLYPVERIINAIIKDGVAAVANGRAEYGPRALGNRSILADPRDPDIKDKVNLIKQRELFRPFAPVVMEEHASEWFDMDYASPYMQYTPKCLKPELVPAVVHVDGTSRVQTVSRKQNPGLYSVLEKWYKLTGVPILLNTSLNVKGQPIINDKVDIRNWEKHYKRKILF
jgi:hypothetical protein